MPIDQTTNRLRMIIALTGFMGCGKSTVGRALALELRWSFVELDERVEAEQQITIADIFRLHGEPAFRRLETAALENVLAQAESSTVISLGGGTFLQPDNRMLLRDAAARVVFLDTPLDELLRRCCGDEGSLRPLAADREGFIGLYEKRLPGYREADLVVASAKKSPEEIAREIAAAWPVTALSKAPGS